MRGLLPAAAFALCLLPTDSVTQAATTVWIGPATGGDFNDPANWSNGVPGATDPLTDLGIFNNNVNGTVTFSASATHYRTFVQNTTGVLEFDLGPNLWTMSSFFLVGAAGGTPTIRVVDGAIQSERILLGTESTGTNASVELTGANTSWNTTFNSAGYQIGLADNASGSSILVNNGATLSGIGQAIVGLVGADNGSLIIDGAGSTLNMGNYIAAGHTKGSTSNAVNNRIEILNGATAYASNIYMSITVGATDNLIRVSDATLNLTGVGGESRVGWADINNEFRVENGAVVTGSNRFLVGRDATSNSGNQMIVENSSLTGAGIESRRGSVTITNSVVDLSQFYNNANMAFEEGGIRANDSAASVFTFNSGTLGTVNANVANGSVFTVGDGGLTTANYMMKQNAAGLNDVHSFADGLFLNSNALLSGNGDIVGNVSAAPGASVDVGDSPGVINVNGDWDNTGLSISLEVDNPVFPGDPGDQYDLLSIVGAFTHGGSVTIDVSGFLLPPGTTPLKLIGWTSEIGNSADTSVSVVGGSIPVEFHSDGLYVLVPEPTTIGLLGLATAGLVTRRRIG